MKKIIRFLGLTVLWFLTGIIIMVASPIFAWLGIESWSEITNKSDEIRDMVEEHKPTQIVEVDEDTRALLEGDALLRQSYEEDE